MQKIDFYNLNNLLEILNIEKNKGKKIVFTNGCFDLLHIGHLRYLIEAKNLGDILVVGLNSDSSIKKFKSENRPIIPELERAELLYSLKPVDYVIIFNDLTADNLLKQIKPDIYVKGGDYILENLPEKNTIKELNIKTVFLPFINGRSTTIIIEKIKNSF